MSSLLKIIVLIWGAVFLLALIPEPPKQIEPVELTEIVTSPTKIPDRNLDRQATSTKIVAATSTTTEKPVVQNKTVVQKVQSAVTAVTNIVEAPATLLDLEELNQRVRPAMVNIFCTTKSSGSFDPITGSGVIIDERGVILTNAHVAQYLLLKDYLTKDFVTCVARTGSPAMTAYKISLIFLPEKWLNENAKSIKEENPLGTGENDYALLLITGSATQNPLPEKFSFVPFSADQKFFLERNYIPLLIIGYPAGFLGGIAAERDLYLSAGPAEVKKLYYFHDPQNVDLISVGGSILAQKGASGGAAVSQETGKLEGILSSITEGATTDERDLSAVTLAHVSRSMKDHLGKTLEEFLGINVQQTAQDFNESSFQTLKETLIEALEPTS